MFKRKLFNSLRSTASLLAGVTVCVCLCIQGLVIATLSEKHIEQESLKSADTPLKEAKLSLENSFGEAKHNVLVISELAGVRRLLKENTAESYQEVEEVLQLIAKNNPAYLQLRVLGLKNAGREVVRVNRTNENVVVVDNTQLQEKAHRDYFRNTMKLKRGEIYVSPFELNREQKEIVTPYQPVVRISAPVFDQAGAFSKLGIVIINIDSNRLFDKVKSFTSKNADFFVANELGQFLYHPNKSLRYAFEFGKDAFVHEQFKETNLLIWGVESHVKFVTPKTRRLRESVAAFQRITLGSGEYSRDLVIGMRQPISDVYVGSAGYWYTVVAIIGVLSVISFFILRKLLQVLLRPLFNMSKQLAKHNDLEQPLSLPQGRDDEIGVLATTINRMQSRIKEQFYQINQQKELLNKIFQSAVDAIIQIDEKGVIESWNFAAEKMFGYGTDEIIGKNVRVLMAEEQAKQHDRHLENYQRTGESTTIGIGREALARKKNGVLFPVHISIGEFEVDGVRKFTGIIYDASQQRAFEDNLRKLACTDGLTGALNQRAFTERAIVETGRAHRQRKSVCLILIDIDYFKDLNDSFGHKAGDQVLKCFVRSARTQLRSHDIIGRLGGDEFAVLCPDTDLSEATIVAKRVRESIVMKPISATYERVRFTVSVGVAEINLAQGEGYDALYSRADQMLYAAKEKGRNCIVEQESIAQKSTG